MRNLKNYAAAMRPVKKGPTVIDLEDEDVLCGKVNEHKMDTELINTSTEPGESNPSNMQHMLCGNDDDDDWDTKIDHQYMMLLDSFSELGNSYPRGNPLRSIRYEVDNGGYDEREFKEVTKKHSREGRNTVRVTKKNVKPKPHVEASTKKAGFDLRRRGSHVTEKSVDAMLIRNHVKRNSQHDVDTGKKKASEGPVVLDEGYKSYLKWLVENSKSSGTNPEKEVQVKCEEDAMSLSDTDIIAVEDHPFLDGEDSPFVPSKDYKVIDLEEKSGDQRKSWFKKEIMSILTQPYNEEEFKELYNEASVRRVLTKSRELRDGREITYKTNQTGPSYLDMYPKFKRKLYESMREKDGHRALNLLRGFIFYLTKVACDVAFKPWRNRECLKITCS